MDRQDLTRRLSVTVNRLEERVRGLEEENNSLLFDIASLRRENEILRELVPTERLYNAFELIEIGFENDSSLHGAESLIEAANSHCSSYDDRSDYLPIDNVDKAIKYFEENGFEVRKMRLEC